MGMRFRSVACAPACVLALGLAPSAFAAYSTTSHSVGTSAQIAWVRSAASRFVAAELAADGAGACAVLIAPLRTVQHHRTCAQRWDAKLTKLLRERGARAGLRREARAIPSARVIVHGDLARIELPTPLLAGASSFYWTENCWMLQG
jgi:hypothetical protein